MHNGFSRANPTNNFLKKHVRDFGTQQGGGFGRGEENFEDEELGDDELMDSGGEMGDDGE